MDGLAIKTLRAPVAPAVVEELIALWALDDVFGCVGDDGAKAVRRAAKAVRGDAAANHPELIIYVCQDQPTGKIAGTAVLLISRDAPVVGTLGEVATHPDYRRRGIAAALCAQSRDDFKALRGEVLMLGTTVVAASRLYHKTGYRRLPGTNAWWLNVRDDRSAEEWQVDYFRTAHATSTSPAPPGSVASVSICIGTAADRLRMPALFHVPHESAVLDSNLKLYSTRAAVQSSVNGLYPRYAALLDPLFANGGGDVVKDGSCHDHGLRGCWWALRSKANAAAAGAAAAAADEKCAGLLVGLATVAIVGDSCNNSVAWLDGFTHARWFEHHWEPLLATALAWVQATTSCAQCYARIAASDAAKLAGFRGLGFKLVGASDGAAGLPTPAPAPPTPPLRARFVYEEGEEGPGYLGPAKSEASLLMAFSF